MSTPEELKAEIEQLQKERRATERENRELRKFVRTEAMPLWDRIKLRRQQNGFGEDYEIALTRRA